MATFLTVGYKRDDGKVVRMRISETLKDFVGNGGAPEKKTSRAKVSKRNGEIGTRPRMIILRRRVGTGENSFIKYERVPCATPEIYNSKLTTDKVTLNAKEWEVLGGMPEDID